MLQVLDLHWWVMQGLNLRPLPCEGLCADKRASRSEVEQAGRPAQKAPADQQIAPELHRVVGMLVAAALLSGCASRPPPAWQDPHAIVPIRWVKVQDPPQSEVRGGACVLYLADTTGYGRLDRIAAEPLVQQCLKAGGLDPGAGDFDLHWLEVDDAAAMAEAKATLYDRSIPALSAGALVKPGTTKRRGDTAGIHRRSGRACQVITRRGWATLGHELKHCYEGDWHR